MAALVQAARGQPGVRAWAERAVAGVRPGDILAEIVAVRDFIADRVEYRRDPDRVEWLQTPWYVLDCQVARGRVPQLDCDDLTTLSLALLGALGHRTAFRVVSHRPDGQFNHVYGLDLTLPGPAVKVDLVDAWRPLGRAAPAETRWMEVAA